MNSKEQRINWTGVIMHGLRACYYALAFGATALEKSWFTMPVFFWGLIVLTLLVLIQKSNTKVEKALKLFEILASQIVVGSVFVYDVNPWLGLMLLFVFNLVLFFTGWRKDEKFDEEKRG